MNWDTAVNLFIQNEAAAKFRVNGNPMNADDKLSLSQLALYFTHGNCILLMRKTFFNCLLSKSLSHEIEMQGDGALSGDQALALCCCLEGLTNVAQLSNPEHKLGAEVEVSAVLNQWRSLLDELEPGTVLQSKDFTKSLMTDQMHSLSDHTLLVEPAISQTL